MQGVMRALICLVALLVLSLVVVPQAMAQSDTTQQAQPAVKIKRSQLLVPPKNADGTIIVTPFLEDPVMWARDEQQNFYGKMSSTLKAVRGPNAMTAGWTLMLLSFAYGIFHAAGPGHGKVVISSYVLANERQYRQGVLLSFASSMLASLVATCKLNGVNPFNYIHQTLRVILDGHPRNQIEQLMPWTCDQASSLAA